MNISSAIFDRSCPDLESCPDESLPEFAFIGRSNVGKSSLLNMLSGKPDLARVSTTPGFTKLINIFTMNKTWRLVDLPGYGFAQVARKDKSKFNAAVADYLEHRENLCCVFSLIDSGLPPQKIDLEFVEWMASKRIPFVLVFTKTDTVSPTAAQANMQEFKARISGWSERLPEIYTCSSKNRQGRIEMLKMISEAIAADDREAVPATGESVGTGDNSSVAPPPVAARDTRPKRPNPARPW